MVWNSGKPEFHATHVLVAEKMWMPGAGPGMTSGGA